MRPWHALLAPLPDGAVPRRQPVASAEILAMPEGAAIAGWEQLVLELTAGADGLRTLLVVLDRDGRPIAASDHVLYRSERDVDGTIEIEYEHASLGGRLEDGGSFKGTRWRAGSVENEAGDVETSAEPSEPTDSDIAAIRALVAELVRRAPTAGED